MRPLYPPACTLAGTQGAPVRQALKQQVVARGAKDGLEGCVCVCRPPRSSRRRSTPTCWGTSRWCAAHPPLASCARVACAAAHGGRDTRAHPRQGRPRVVQPGRARRECATALACLRARAQGAGRGAGGAVPHASVAVPSPCSGVGVLARVCRHESRSARGARSAFGNTRRPSRSPKVRALPGQRLAR